MRTNCKIGRVTPKKNIKLLPARDYDVTILLNEAEEFFRTNGCAAAGLFIAGRGKTYLSVIGNYSHAMGGASALTHKIGKMFLGVHQEEE